MKRIFGVFKKIQRVVDGGFTNKSDGEKIVLLEMLLKLASSRKKKFGLFVIFGWEDKWNDYAVLSDSSQDLFSKNKMNIFDEKSLKKIATTVDFDGAILVDRGGKILHSGVILEGLRPSKLALIVTFKKIDGDFSARLGFKKKVHTRHMAAISSSYQFQGAVVYTVSEETGDVHMFEGGKIVFSTVKGETK